MTSLSRAVIASLSVHNDMQNMHFLWSQRFLIIVVHINMLALYALTPLHVKKTMFKPSHWSRINMTRQQSLFTLAKMILCNFNAEISRTKGVLLSDCLFVRPFLFNLNPLLRYTLRLEIDFKLTEVKNSNYPKPIWYKI